MKMRFGRQRRRCRRLCRTDRGLHKGCVALLAFCSLGCVSAMWLLHFRPLATQIAASYLQQAATEAISQTVSEAFSGNVPEYDRLMSFICDSNGRITAVTANAAAVNRLKSDLSLEISERLRELGEVGFAIPVGSLTGSLMLSGLGPELPLRFVPYGSVGVEVCSSFARAGINQTHHQVYLEIHTRVAAILPGLPAEAEVKTAVPVVQALIVGEVPDSYAQVGDEDTARENLFDIMP